MDLVPGQVVLIYNVSRFGRNLQESINYLEKIHLLGCYVYSVADQTASSEINFITLAQKAQEESDALSRIMRESIARRRATGVHVGPAPFGKRIYRDEDGNRRLADNLEEIAIIQTLKEVFNATGSIRSTIIELNQRQMLFRGKHWDKPKVIKVLNIF